MLIFCVGTLGISYSMYAGYDAQVPLSLERQLNAAPLRRLQASSQSMDISESYFKRALTLHLDL
jgi:hypothetical protein